MQMFDGPFEVMVLQEKRVQVWEKVNRELYTDADQLERDWIERQSGSRKMKAAKDYE